MSHSIYLDDCEDEKDHIQYRGEHEKSRKLFDCHSRKACMTNRGILEVVCSFVLVAWYNTQSNTHQTP